MAIPSCPTKPRLWSEKQITGAINTVKNIDLAPDRKRIAAMMPATVVHGSARGQNHFVYLENFIDELRRKVPGRPRNGNRR
jgi:hypothetical protein